MKEVFKKCLLQSFLNQMEDIIVKHYYVKVNEISEEYYTRKLKVCTVCSIMNVLLYLFIGIRI